MAYVDYNPKKHAGKRLYAIEDGEQTPDGAIPTILRPVTDPDEIAAAADVWWYYVVDVEESAGAAA